MIINPADLKVGQTVAVRDRVEGVIAKIAPDGLIDLDDGSGKTLRFYLRRTDSVIRTWELITDVPAKPGDFARDPETDTVWVRTDLTGAEDSWWVQVTGFRGWRSRTLCPAWSSQADIIARLVPCETPWSAT